MLAPVLLDELSTPTAVVDLDRAERNAARMRRRMADLDVRLRPHVKTHKTVEGARLQLGAGSGPITVSTLAEARLFAGAGFADMIWAVPVAPRRLGEVVELNRRVRLDVLADHPAVVAEIGRAAGESGVDLGVWLKVDCGYHRAGVDPDRPESVDLAREAAAAGVVLRGLLTHAGHAYHCRTTDEIAEVARQERAVTVAFADRVRAAGTAIAEVSVGSTPTMSVAADLAGVTEARPGNYLFFDAFQAAIGSCSPDDCAFSVIATVIASHPERRAAVVDTGALALSKDAGACHVDADAGFGMVLDRHGAPRRGVRLTALSQEHGIVAVEREADAAALVPGTRLRIVPNHSCLAAACFDRFAVVRGDRVVDEWVPTRGW